MSISTSLLNRKERYSIRLKGQHLNTILHGVGQSYSIEKTQGSWTCLVFCLHARHQNYVLDSVLWASVISKPCVAVKPIVVAKTKYSQFKDFNSIVYISKLAFLFYEDAVEIVMAFLQVCNFSKVFSILCYITVYLIMYIYDRSGNKVLIYV